MCFSYVCVGTVCFIAGHQIPYSKVAPAATSRVLVGWLVGQLVGQLDLPNMCEG